MNNMLKQAYDLGARAALSDLGISYGVEKVATEISISDEKMGPDYLGKPDLGTLVSGYAGLAAPFLGGAVGAGTGALIGNLIDRYRDEEGYFGDKKGTHVGTALGALLGGVGTTYGGLRAAKHIAEEEPMAVRVFPSNGGVGMSPVVNKNLLARGGSFGLATAAPAVGLLAGGGLGFGLGHLIDNYRGEDGSFGDHYGAGIGAALGSVLGGLGGLYGGYRGHRSVVETEPKSGIIHLYDDGDDK